jgi:hypothetical protein
VITASGKDTSSGEVISSGISSWRSWRLIDDYLVARTFRPDTRPLANFGDKGTASHARLGRKPPHNLASGHSIRRYIGVRPRA